MRLSGTKWDTVSQQKDAKNNFGHDADTTGAICGQLAGACWGEVGIPHEWLNETGAEGPDRAGIDRLL